MNTTRTLNMHPEDFRSAGHLLVDEIANFLKNLPKLKVTTSKSPSELRAALPENSLPSNGMDTSELILETMNLLVENSLFNGHPKFWGYITSSASPLGALADLLASSINANVGAQTLSPIATEIEKQTIAWLGDLIGYGENTEGVFVSGGNMANFLGYIAAQKRFILNQSPNNNNKQTNFVLYCAKGTHTWVQKANDLFGSRGDIIRWVETNIHGQMDITILKQLLIKDKKEGKSPFLIIGNAGTVETGSVDELIQIGSICKEHDIWFHVDGAYGALASALPEYSKMFEGLKNADSMAIDPHKWLYSPIEAGCILVKDNRYLKKAFSHKPVYYNFDGEDTDMPLNFHELGLQNSRGFRALKVWMSLRQIGKNGFIEMMRHDIKMAKKLFEMAEIHNNLEVVTNNLSITTFRYVPQNSQNEYPLEYLNSLNQKLLDLLQKGGDVFLSNAIVNDKYCLRVCVVNFRTQESDIEELIKIVDLEGGKIHSQMKS